MTSARHTTPKPETPQATPHMDVENAGQTVHNAAIVEGCPPPTPDPHVTTPRLDPAHCAFCAWLVEPGKGRWCELHRMFQLMSPVLPTRWARTVHPSDCPDCQQETPA
jgi:hypothetical protein